MQYSKAMVDLIQEARRRAPSKDKPSIKLANPDVLFELQKLYQKSSDAVFKALVKEIFALAGSPWSKQLENNPNAEATEKSAITASRPKRMYRGQVVA